MLQLQILTLGMQQVAHINVFNQPHSLKERTHGMQTNAHACVSSQPHAQHHFHLGMRQNVNVLVFSHSHAQMEQNLTLHLALAKCQAQLSQQEVVLESLLFGTLLKDASHAQQIYQLTTPNLAVVSVMARDLSHQVLSRYGM